MEFVLFSDGGGLKESVAAGACIVENKATTERKNIVIFLGGATNNEAEITGGLIGLAFIRHSLAQSEVNAGAVHWVADSEYTLKSATQYILNWQRNGWRTAAKKPVKNQGLWRLYLWLATGLDVQMEHVAGHAGHTENEACDSASTWAQLNASEVFLGAAKTAEVQIDGAEWLLLDGREFIQRIREDHPTEDDCKLLGDLIRAAV